MVAFDEGQPATDLVSVAVNRAPNAGVECQGVEQLNLSYEIHPHTFTVEGGHAEGVQHIVFIGIDACVVVLGIEDGIAEGEAIGFVFRFVGNVLAEEITVLVAAIIITIVGIFSLVAAMKVPANLIVDVEADGVLGIEDGVVAEDKSVRRVLHLGLGAELQVGISSFAEAVADAQIVVVATAGCVDL